MKDSAATTDPAARFTSSPAWSTTLPFVDRNEPVAVTVMSSSTLATFSRAVMRMSDAAVMLVEISTGLWAVSRTWPPDSIPFGLPVTPPTTSFPVLSMNVLPVVDVPSTLAIFVRMGLLALPMSAEANR